MHAMETIETDTDLGQNGETGSISVERGMEMMRRLADRLELLIRERPGVALLGALGLGFVIGRIVRR
jgi:hypothetical protein